VLSLRNRGWFLSHLNFFDLEFISAQGEIGLPFQPLSWLQNSLGNKGEVVFRRHREPVCRLELQDISPLPTPRTAETWLKGGRIAPENFSHMSLA
jgi:hypothetical protein